MAINDPTHIDEKKTKHPHETAGEDTPTPLVLEEDDNTTVTTSPEENTEKPETAITTQPRLYEEDPGLFYTSHTKAPEEPKNQEKTSVFDANLTTQQTLIAEKGNAGLNLGDSEALRKKHAKEEARQRARDALSIIELERAYAELEVKLAEIEQNLGNTDTKFAALSTQTENTLNQLKTIQENLKDTITQEENILKQMKNGTYEEEFFVNATPEEQQNLIEEKEQEINTLQNELTQLNNDITYVEAEKQQLAQDIREAQTEMQNLNTAIQQGKESDKTGEKLEALQQRTEKLNNNATAIEERVNKFESTIKRLASYAQTAEQKEQITASLLAATDDGTLTTAELETTKEILGNAGISNNAIEEFGADYTTGGGTVTTETGEQLTDRAAQDALKAALFVEIAEQHETVIGSLIDTFEQAAMAETEQKTLQQDKAKAENTLTEEKQDLAAIESNLETEDQKASFNLALGTDTGSQSLETHTIKDTNGNEVHIDRSTEPPTYYHLDDSGARIAYDPEKDAEQIANFEQGLDGDGKINGKIHIFDAPPTHFANDEIDHKALALHENTIRSEQDIASLNVELADIAARIDTLNETSAMLEEDRAALESIRQKLENNEITPAQAQIALNDLNLEEQYADTQDSESDTEEKWTADETNEFSTPKFTLQQMRDAELEAESVMKALGESGGTLSAELREELLRKGVAPEKLDEMANENGVEVENDLLDEIGLGSRPLGGAIKMATTAGALGMVGPMAFTSSIAAASTFQPDPNNISHAETYPPSVIDEYPQYNEAGASYAYTPPPTADVSNAFATAENGIIPEQDITVAPPPPAPTNISTDPYLLEPNNDPNGPKPPTWS